MKIRVRSGTREHARGNSTRRPVNVRDFRARLRVLLLVRLSLYVPE